MADRKSGTANGEQEESRATAIAYGRGLMGAMLLGVPVLMTMEVWWEGFMVPAWRQLLMYAVNFGVLLILQHYSGLHHRKTMASQVRAAFVALGLGILASAITLVALGVLRQGTDIRDVAGKLLLESIPLSIGASISMSEFGEENRIAEDRRENVGYWGSLALALAGASVFGFGLSATEEPLMIAAQLSWWQALTLVIISIVQVHITVYVVDFKQRHQSGAKGQRMAFLRDAVSTYALAVVVAGYYLWTFGTLTPDTALTPAAYLLAVTGFVTSFGAAAGELLI